MFGNVLPLISAIKRYSESLRRKGYPHTSSPVRSDCELSDLCNTKRMFTGTSEIISLLAQENALRADFGNVS